MTAALTRIADDVWHLDGGAVRQPGGVRMPSRSTLVRLTDGSLVVYSPAAVDDALAAEIDRLGPVAHLVAPNRLHHLFLGPAIARWPRATVHGAPGLAAKCRALHFDRELGVSVEPAWREQLDVEVIGGAPRLNETVLFHRPSGTLLCADLVFHVTRPANWQTRLVLALVGAGGGRVAQSRAWHLLRADRAAVRASIDRVLSWPIERIAPCHGEPADIDPAALARVVSRAYGGTPARLLEPRG